MDAATPRFRVLIVDDAPSVREALRWALESEDDLAVVGEAGDGVEGFERAAALVPDVTILDIEMPGLDGYALAREVKTLAHAPAVVFLTVHSDGVSRQRAAAAGGDGFVDKGIGWPALIDEVRHALIGRTPFAPPVADADGPGGSSEKAAA